MKKAPKKPRKVTAYRASGAQVRMLLKLPLGYLRILGEEAQRLHMGRGDFINALVLRRLGQIELGRVSGPEYQVTTEELSTKGNYFWYVTPEVRDQVDDMRLSIGGLGLGDFIVLMLNDWLGRPGGLKRRPDKK